MHGTGTPLGDPIEIGGLTAVFAAPPPRRGAFLSASPAVKPVTLMASKSWNGHAEPAAGLIGVIHARRALQNFAAMPVMHLRELNAYVAAGLRQSTAGSSAAMARQPASAASAAAQSVCGVSAFAFQVSN